MRSVVGLGAADWLAFPGVQSELIPKDAFDNAGFIEGIPVSLDEHGDFALSLKIDIIANAEVFLKFKFVGVIIPQAHVISRGEVSEDGLGVRQGCSMAGEKQDAIIQVRVNVSRLVFVFGLWSPELWRNFNVVAADLCGNVQGEASAGAWHGVW